MAKVEEYDNKCLEIMIGDSPSYAVFQSGTRQGELSLRYRGEGRVAKLKALKKEWDPTGVFTTQLLK